MLSNVCALKSWVAEIEKETRSARKKKALERIALNDARAYQWLKRPAATEKPRDITDPMPVAPEDQLLYVKHKWEAIWMQPPLQNSEVLDQMMDNFPSHPHVEIVHSELYKLEQKTKGKAAGPDGWQGRLFAALPESAFSPLAMLWHLCLEHSMLPSTWCQARTVLIDKPDGDKRPLSIASLCWRLCASATLRKLQPWIATWIHKDPCGGLPDTRADFLHQRLMPDLQSDETPRPKVIGVKQDLSKCFDNTCSQQAITILAKFGLPPKIVRILETFYRNHIRWLEIDGCVSAEPIKPLRSILQGCPFSVVLLSGIMTLWATQMHIRFPLLNVGVYIDDRTLWLKDQHVQNLQHAIQHSNLLDEHFGFKSNKNKEAFFANTPSLRKKLKAFGSTYPWFSLLGIHYQRNFFSADHTNTIAKNLDLLLSRIRFLFRSRDRRRVFVRTLVLPMITWAAAWATHSDKFIQKTAIKIEKCILGHLAPGRSPTLVWAILGLNVHPLFQQFAVAFRVWEWQIWKKCHGGKTPILSSAARKMFGLLKWTPSPDGSIETPNGNLVIGVDSSNSILQLAKLSFYHHLWGKDKRVCAIEKEKWPDLQIQLDAGKSLDGLSWAYESAITGAAVDGRMTQAFTRQDVTCRCGETNPTRRHLLWHCNALQSARLKHGLADSPQPATAEEGLLVNIAPFLVTSLRSRFTLWSLTRNLNKFVTW